MRTEEFPEKPDPKEMARVLSEIEADMKKFPAIPLMPDKKEGSGVRKETPLESWVENNIPVKLQDSWQPRLIFKKISLGKMFQGIWNYEISFLPGLSEKSLVIRSCKIREDLGKLSELILKSEGIADSKNIRDEIDEIKREIEFLETTIEDLSIGTLKNSESVFGANASHYLNRKIVIEKLEELLSVLENYKCV